MAATGSAAPGKRHRYARGLAITVAPGVLVKGINKENPPRPVYLIGFCKIPVHHNLTIRKPSSAVEIYA